MTNIKNLQFRSNSALKQHNIARSTNALNNSGNNQAQASLEELLQLISKFNKNHKTTKEAKEPKESEKSFLENYWPWLTGALISLGAIGTGAWHFNKRSPDNLSTDREHTILAAMKHDNNGLSCHTASLLNIIMAHYALTPEGLPENLKWLKEKGAVKKALSLLRDTTSINEVREALTLDIDYLPAYISQIAPYLLLEEVFKIPSAVHWLKVENKSDGKIIEMAPDLHKLLSDLKENKLAIFGVAGKQFYDGAGHFFSCYGLEKGQDFEEFLEKLNDFVTEKSSEFPELESFKDIGQFLIFDQNGRKQFKLDIKEAWKLKDFFAIVPFSKFSEDKSVFPEAVLKAIKESN